MNSFILNFELWKKNNIFFHFFFSFSLHFLFKFGSVSNAQSVHSFTWTPSCLLLIQLSYFTFDLSFFMFLFLVSTNFYGWQFICFVLLFMFGWVFCIGQTPYSYLLFFFVCHHISFVIARTVWHVLFLLTSLTHNYVFIYQSLM